MVKGKISETDFVEAAKLSAQLRLCQKKLYGTLLALSAIVTALIISTERYVWILSISIGVIGGIIVGLVGRKILVPFRARRSYRQLKYLDQEVQYNWSTEGLSVVTQTSNAKNPWSHYVRYQENSTVFLLYFSDALFNCIPKSFFMDQGQIDEFRKMVLSNSIGTEKKQS